MILNMVFDSRKKMPFYVQFAEHIKMLVADRIISYGFIFDDPKVISKDLGISIDDVIKGFNLLIAEGYLTFHQDTYQLLPIMLTQEFFSEIIPLLDSIAGMGYSPSLKTVLLKDVKKLPEQFNEVHLDPLGYLYLRRVYYANQTPIAVTDAFYPKSLLGNRASYTFESEPMYKFFTAQGHTLSKTKRHIRVAHPPKEINTLLHHPSGVSSIQITGITKNAENEVLEYVISHASINYTIYKKELLKKKI
jgi:DNA-binding GntR family transcriptional regulator